MVRKKNIIIRNVLFVILFILIIGGIIYGVSQGIFLDKESFEVNSALLKMNLPSGGLVSFDLEITNNLAKNQGFSLYFENLNTIASLEEYEFVVGGRGTKKVRAFFKDSMNQPNVYVGELVIEAESTKKIPVILSINDEGKNFAITQRVITSYQEAHPGEEFGMEVTLTNLKDHKSHNVEVIYIIKNLQGEVFVEEKETLEVKNTVSKIKVLDIPKNAKYGKYVFIATVNNGGKSTASYPFEIIKKRLPDVIYVLIIFAVFVVGTVIFFFYFVKTSGLTKLRRQHAEERRINLGEIKDYKKRIKEIRNRAKREIRLKQLRKAKEKILLELDKKHKEQVEEIRKLKKAGRKKIIEDRLESWKKQGYRMVEFKKHISKAKIKKEISKLRRQGYKTDFLNK